MADPADPTARLVRDLAVYGADLARWPEGRGVEARAALLAVPAFRRVWEAESDFDRALSGARAELDGAIANSGAAGRVHRRVLAQFSAGALAAMPWHRIAAAMLIAGMLGGAADLVIAEPAADPADVAVVDPLDWPDEPGSP